MTGKRFESVWDAVTDTPREAAAMKLQSAVMIELRRYIEERGLDRSDAAALFGLPPSRVADLMNGKIDRFTLDALVAMSVAAGITTDAGHGLHDVKEPPAATKGGT
ncbi:helix-turn-helix domain-containing protein [Pinisolibacter aquiterrae]|uniref:helix-turn-helix domain-containing protein n=1 Tax=Pinisolibacter aquiterrae TaxID=2815579 RepID=UPI001C3E6A6F|nr:XRE family transcriptional regulator [Pinisolibacter aquiterrae]MBV5265386.1 XRE family transcriptional regulator [Pinisolibacter aquiterrae]MCC8235238.1 XRE family transcriptional regulator [Pinisolibacter aquiterrae]